MMGTAPKAQQQSVFQRTPWATLPALQPHPPSRAYVLGPEPRCCAHTGTFVHKARTQEQRRLPLVLSLRPGKKGLAVQLPEQPAVETERFLAES